MSSDRVTSDLFVGREDELTLFAELIAENASFKILNMYGEAGIGKTSLLRQIPALCQKENVQTTLVTLDGYDSESRHTPGILNQLAQQLAPAQFSAIDCSATAPQEIESIEHIFWHEYRAYAEQLAPSGKTILLIFDSYEYLQQREPDWMEAHLFPHLSENTRVVVAGREALRDSSSQVRKQKLGGFTLDQTAEFLHACSRRYHAGKLHVYTPAKPEIPAELHQKIVEFLTSLPNVHDSGMRRALIAGLDTALQSTIDVHGAPDQFCQCLVETLSCHGMVDDEHYALDVVLESAKNRVGKKRQEYCDSLIQQLHGIDRALLRKIQALTGGHPILLALFMDWVTGTTNLRSPQELITTIEVETGPISLPSATQEQRTAFEHLLITRVSSLASPEFAALISMTVACHRITPEMFQALNPGVSDLECQAIFEQLCAFSFVKQKTPNILLLHDEMRRIVEQWLNEVHDKTRFMRKPLAKELVQYYDTLLQQADISAIEKEIYALEQVDYALLADPEHGIQRFREQFDQAFEQQKYEFVRLLLAEVQTYQDQNPDDFSDHNVLNIITERRQRHDESTLSSEKTPADSQEKYWERYDELQEWFGRVEKDYERYTSTHENYAETMKIHHEHMRKHFRDLEAMLIPQTLPETLPNTGESCDTPIRLLHLSDLHFTRNNDVIAALQPLVDDVKDKRGGLGFTHLDYLVISGDLTTTASQEEFEVARELIIRLINEFGCPIEHCLIVPGNHDLSWEEFVYDWRSERAAKNIADMNPADYVQQGSGYLIRGDDIRYRQRFNNFSEYVFRRLFNKTYPLDEKEQCLQSYSAATKLQCLTLNSSWQIDECFPKRSGIVQGALERGLAKANAELSKRGIKKEAVLRIAVLHHPVSGSDKIKQDGFVEQLQKAEVSVILHGHVHEERADVLHYFRPPHIYAIGAGSFGAPTNARPESTPRSYNVLEIQRDFSRIRVHTRCRRKRDGAWEGWALWPVENSTDRRIYYDILLKPHP